MLPAGSLINSGGRSLTSCTDTCTVHVLIPPSSPIYDIYLQIHVQYMYSYLLSHLYMIFMYLYLYSTCTHTSFLTYIWYLCTDTCTVHVLIPPFSPIYDIYLQILVQYMYSYLLPRLYMIFMYSICSHTSFSIFIWNLCTDTFTVHVPIPFSSPLYGMYGDTCTVHVLVIVIPPSLPLYDIYVIPVQYMYSYLRPHVYVIFMHRYLYSTCTKHTF